jgi:hypothetical protein
MSIRYGDFSIITHPMIWSCSRLADFAAGCSESRANEPHTPRTRVPEMIV